MRENKRCIVFSGFKLLEALFFYSDSFPALAYKQDIVSIKTNPSLK